MFNHIHIIYHTSMIQLNFIYSFRTINWYMRYYVKVKTNTFLSIHTYFIDINSMETSNKYSYIE